jgi:CheY-like chemotaxis protein
MGDPKNQAIAVLVVEDEYLIRMDTATSLEAAGFAVFEADNAADAIGCLELHKENQTYLYRHKHAWFDGWFSARTSCSRPMATRKNHCYFGLY